MKRSVIVLAAGLVGVLVLARTPVFDQGYSAVRDESLTGFSMLKSWAGALDEKVNEASSR